MINQDETIQEYVKKIIKAINGGPAEICLIALFNVIGLCVKNSPNRCFPLDEETNVSLKELFSNMLENITFKHLDDLEKN